MISFVVKFVFPIPTNNNTNNDKKNNNLKKAYGAAEYIKISETFHTVFLSGIPMLSVERKNEARRFITLIDELYEHKVKLICTAEKPAIALFMGNKSEKELSEEEKHFDFSG